MRTWSPDLRTLPSSTVATPSSRPISLIFTFLPLKANAEVREATRSPGTLASRLRSSSVSPSEKYSCSRSELRFTSGRTAMEGAACSAEGGAGSLGRAVPRARPGEVVDQPRGGRRATEPEEQEGEAGAAESRARRRGRLLHHGGWRPLDPAGREVEHPGQRRRGREPEAEEHHHEAERPLRQVEAVHDRLVDLEDRERQDAPDQQAADHPPAPQLRHEVLESRHSTHHSAATPRRMDPAGRPRPSLPTTR